MLTKIRRALATVARYERGGPVNLAIVVVTGAVFGVHSYLSRASEDVDWLWLNLSYDRYLVLHGQPWRLISPNLIHTATWWQPSGALAWLGRAGLLHLAAVLIALLAFGPLVERTFGHRRFAVIYAASGFAAYGLLLSRTTPVNLHGGATGAVYGIFAAFLVFMLRHWREPEYGRYVRPALAMFVVLTAAQYGWNLWAARFMHIGGFAAGIVLGLVLDPTGKAPPAEQPLVYESIFNQSP